MDIFLEGPCFVKMLNQMVVTALVVQDSDAWSSHRDKDSGKATQVANKGYDALHEALADRLVRA